VLRAPRYPYTQGLLPPSTSLQKETDIPGTVAACGIAAVPELRSISADQAARCVLA